jgi:hypothetical protein
LVVLDLIDGGRVRVRRCELDRHIEPFGEFPTEIDDYSIELSGFLIADGNVR